LAINKFFFFFLCYDNHFSTKIAGFNERTIIAAISDLRSRIDRLHVTITKIYVATCHPEETPENSIGIPILPLTSMEAFYEWENFNLDEEKKLIMVKIKFSLSLVLKIYSDCHYSDCLSISHFHLL